jgi:hypothetical protein
MYSGNQEIKSKFSNNLRTRPQERKRIENFAAESLELNRRIMENLHGKSQTKLKKLTQDGVRPPTPKGSPSPRTKKRLEKFKSGIRGTPFSQLHRP